MQDVRFDSSDYHTDGAPTDYVYQSWVVSTTAQISNKLQHVLCLPPSTRTPCSRRPCGPLRPAWGTRPPPTSGSQSGSLSRSWPLLWGGPCTTCVVSAAALRPAPTTPAGRRPCASKWQTDYFTYLALTTSCISLLTPHPLDTNSWISCHLSTQHMIFNQCIYPNDFIFVFVMFYCNWFGSPFTESKGQNLDRTFRVLALWEFLCKFIPPAPTAKCFQPFLSLATSPRHQAPVAFRLSKRTLKTVII